MPKFHHKTLVETPLHASNPNPSAMDGRSPSPDAGTKACHLSSLDTLPYASAELRNTDTEEQSSSRIRIYQQSQSKLLALPVEVRLIILDMCVGAELFHILSTSSHMCEAERVPLLSHGSHFFCSGPHYCHTHLRDLTSPCRRCSHTRLPGLTASCRQLYLETRPILYKNTTLSFMSSAIFLAFASDHSAALAYLRKVHLHLGVPKPAPALMNQLPPQTVPANTEQYRDTDTAIASLSMLSSLPSITRISLSWAYTHQSYIDQWPIPASTLVQISQFQNLAELSLAIDEPPPGPVDCYFFTAEDGKLRLGWKIKAIQNVLTRIVCRKAEHDTEDCGSGYINSTETWLPRRANEHESDVRKQYEKDAALLIKSEREKQRWSCLTDL